MLVERLISNQMVAGSIPACRIVGFTHDPGKGKVITMTALNQPVMVLNSGWQPIKVVSARKAFKMLFNGVAEVIDVEDGAYCQYNFDSWADLSEYKKAFESERYPWVRSLAFDVAVPALIRLLRFSRSKRQRVKLTRAHVFARDRSTCQYCGQQFEKSELNLDHVLPSSRGGKTRWDNIVCSCVSCNTKKADRTPGEASMPLVRDPYEPRPEEVQLLAALQKHRRDSWEHFVDAAYWNVELRD